MRNSSKGNIAPRSSYKKYLEQRDRIAKGLASVSDWLKENDTMEKRLQKRDGFTPSSIKREEERDAPWVIGRQL